MANPTATLCAPFPPARLRPWRGAGARGPPTAATPGGMRRENGKSPECGRCVAETLRKEIVMTRKQLCACAVALLVFGWGITPGVVAREAVNARGIPSAAEAVDAEAF
jgi:hypothetical protein